MSKELILFKKDSLSFNEKFFILMDILITNQPASRTECVIFFSISYLQMISGFFAKQIGVFNNESSSDKLLFYLEKIIRLIDLIVDKYSEFKFIISALLSILILFIIFCFIVCSKIHENSFYSYNEKIINYFIKCFVFIGFNIILDFVFANFCFGENETNPYFKGVSCSINEHVFIIILSLLLFIVSVVLIFFLQCFYCDSFYLSTSYFSRISCNYEIYNSLNCIFYSIFLIQSKYLSKEIFLLYNMTISILFLRFYLKHYLYYDSITNSLVGLFHILYVWTSLFCLIFAYIHFYEKGIIYLTSSVIISYFYYSLKNRIEEKIFLDTPFYKITNKSHFLYYIKNLIDKINNVNENPEKKAILAGIIHMHSVECPNPNCLAKTKEKIYLPITNQWSDRSKPNIDDNVFLINFVIIVMSYFIDQNYYSPDLIINLSFYYLEIIGNYCLSMFFYKKVKKMKLTFQEKFSLERLKIKISNALIEKLKSPLEECTSIKDLDTTIYFKYSDLSDKFIDEISNDINLSLEFWKIFQKAHIDSKTQIDFNKIFFLTNRIRITKDRIEKLWNKLISIYSGVNDLFILYSDYVEQINDDDLKKRDLESLKRKNENFSEQLSQNYYSMIFNKETGIIIANGDKGKEGIIEKANLQIEKIFKYKYDELKGMNINILMPKIYSKIHTDFMKRYYEIGEKIAIDKKDLKTFGKDRENTIVMIQLIVKLFPILNENVYFIGIIAKENIDDIIFIDSKFNIQGTSSKIMKILNLDNNLLFQENDIPFYVICKQFINFHKIFLQGKKQNEKESQTKKSNSLLIETSSHVNDISESNNESILSKSVNNKNEIKDKEKEKEKELQENVEINENIELEYEILLPEFLINYSESSKIGNLNEKDTQIIQQDSYLDPRNDELNNNETIDEFGENDLLVNEEEKNFNDNENSTEEIEKGKNKIKTKGNVVSNLLNNVSHKRLRISFTPQPTSLSKNINLSLPTTIGQTPSPTLTPTPTPKMNDFETIKPYEQNELPEILNVSRMENQDEDYKEFSSKIKKYRELFESGKFEELCEFIDECNYDNNSQVFKFNFTFDRIKFGNQNMAYIIRCIDNKNDASKDDEDSFDDPKINKYKKEKADAIKPLYELLNQEKSLIIAQPHNFYTLSIQNQNFQNLLDLCRQDINKMSMVHGQKKDEIMDDENASQIGQTGFNSDLVKKERIEEIRANLLTNISNFYTLKYIKSSVFLISLFTILYGIIYLILFYKIFDDLKTVNKLNIELFQITNWLISLIGGLVSLRTLHKKTEYNLTYSFNSFINNNEEYFSYLKSQCYSLYNNITYYFGEFEHKIGKYLDKENTLNLFWDSEKMNYYYHELNDKGLFPSLLAQTMSDINSLLLNQNFNLNNIVLDENTKNYIDYISYIAIENTYDNLIPNLFLKILKIPNLLQSFNGSSRNILFVFLLIYALLMVIFCIFYSVLLYISNLNMGEGLEKILKIKLEKIDETIKKIEGFNISLRNYFLKDLENASTKEGNNDKLIDPSSQIQKGSNNTNEEQSQIRTTSTLNLSGFASDSKKTIPLKVLTSAYLQTGMLFCILCAFLIPIYLITNSMVTSTNKLINVENYIFGKIIMAGASTLKIKCLLSECNNTNQLNYSELVNLNNIQKIIQGISLFKELNVYYNDYYLLNACKAVYLEDSEKYQNCLENELVKSANNTDSLLKLVEETVDDLIKDINLYSELNYILINGEKVEFKYYYLYESTSFNNLETIYYNYVAPVSDNFAKICSLSLLHFLKNKRNSVVFLAIIFFIMVLFQCTYIAFCFIKKLIYLLGVSRCIVKIIPSNVINSTQELENWIEENKT